MEERFYYLVKRKMAGDLTAVEQDELKALLQADEHFEQLYVLLFSRETKLNEDDLLEAEQAYASHYVKMQIEQQFAGLENAGVVKEFPLRRNKQPWYWMAAAIFLLLAAGVYFFKKEGIQDPVKPNTNEIATRKGSKSRIVLPDGSIVWLNADSKIVYPENFKGETREVQLAGEAYFEVAKDKSRPFIIHTASIDVKVLGTAFNVRSYPEESTTETSLLHGMIEVTLHSQPDKKIVLKPAEKLTVSNSTERRSDTAKAPSLNLQNENQPLLVLSKIHFQKKDSSVTESSWIENKLSFENEPFERVASKIERWFNVEIVIETAEVKQMHFSAVFENKSLEQVMEAISLSSNLRYKIKENKVIVF